MIASCFSAKCALNLARSSVALFRDCKPVLVLFFSQKGTWFYLFVPWAGMQSHIPFPAMQTFSWSWARRSLRAMVTTVRLRWTCALWCGKCSKLTRSFLTTFSITLIRYTNPTRATHPRCSIKARGGINFHISGPFFGSTEHNYWCRFWGTKRFLIAWTVRTHCSLLPIKFFCVVLFDPIRPSILHLVENLVSFRVRHLLTRPERSSNLISMLLTIILLGLIAAQKGKRTGLEVLFELCSQEH